MIIFIATPVRADNIQETNILGNDTEITCDDNILPSTELAFTASPATTENITQTPTPINPTSPTIIFVSTTADETEAAEPLSWWLIIIIVIGGLAIILVTWRLIRRTR